MFDPFGDFGSKGYLRNHFREKDLELVKKLEHDFFAANVPDALEYLAKKKTIGYEDFLEVHRILFGDFYPWAGQDRAQCAPNISVSKAGLFFAHPTLEAKRVVEHGLELGQNKAKMRQSPGFVMGMFAFGHPFLDGNGRTMLVVHAELCFRAGFSIAWDQTAKRDYLSALSEEISNPNMGTLDKYLETFRSKRLDRDIWLTSLASIKGLDGQDVEDKVEGDLHDPQVQAKYNAFYEQRGYEIQAAKGISHNDVDENGETALHKAHDSAAFRELLKDGADPFFCPINAKPDYLTPFQGVVKKGDVEKVKACVATGLVDFGQRTLDGKSLKQLAGPSEAVRSYLQEAKEQAISNPLVSEPQEPLSEMSDPTKPGDR